MNASFVVVVVTIMKLHSRSIPLACDCCNNVSACGHTMTSYIVIRQLVSVLYICVHATAVLL